MKATLNIPNSVIDEAQKLSNQKTRTAVIIKALQEYTRMLKREKLLSFKGKKLLADDFDFQKLREKEINEIHNG